MSKSTNFHTQTLSEDLIPAHRYFAIEPAVTATPILKEKDKKRLRLLTWVQRLHLSLLQKILVANLAIILGSAIVGSWLTAKLTESGQFNTQTFVIMIVLAVTLSGSISYVILKKAFQPFDELQRVLLKIHTGNSRARATFDKITDPNLKHFSSALNQMFSRLEENARIIQEDQHQLQLMTARVINAQENERKRISRELHDEASQSLTAMIMGLEAARHSAEDNPPLQNRLAGLKELATTTLEELRKLALDLRPTMLDDLGLVPAVRWCARQGSEAANFQVRVELEGLSESERLAPELETCLFRIVQECLTNIVKYAKASLVTIRLQRLATGELNLTVSDNGVGFDLQAARLEAYNGGHLGLFDIEERAALLGGHVKIHSRQGEHSGTYTQVKIPAKA
jgi:two-component system sensor histidine kinase UhpB